MLYPAPYKGREVTGKLKQKSRAKSCSKEKWWILMVGAKCSGQVRHREKLGISTREIDSRHPQVAHLHLSSPPLHLHLSCTQGTA